jgi:putative transposase
VEELETRVRKLRLEHDILNKSNELLKKDLGIDLLKLTSREKTQMVDALRANHPLEDLLSELRLARSTYFYNRLRNRLADKYAQVRSLITDIFHGNYDCYGYRRIDGTLRREGVRISEKVVRRLMSEQGLVVKKPRRRRFTAYAGDPSPAVENLVERDFHAATPNTKWLTDLTEIHIPAGKVYLSPIIDCFDGLVVSWTMGIRPDGQLVNTMLDQAIETLQPGEHPIIHSDRGAHYRWPQWISRTRKAKLTRSMSKKGCSPDNGACEGFFGRLKTELIYPRHWRDVALDECMRQIDTYIRWYNERRIKLSLGRRSPREYRQDLGLIPS